MQLLVVKCFPAQQRLEAYVRLDDGSTIRVPLKWHSKMPGPPPANWADSVFAEVQNYLARRQSPWGAFS
jgi:hypothetical protein